MKHSIGIYIHIPFCVRKCRYCDFLSAPADDRTRHRYAIALCNEMRTVSDRFADQCVDTVFLGGGTPTTLDPADLYMIMECLRESFDVLPDAEITMEMNPGTYSGEMLAFVRDHLTRISIGLQSADNGELRTLGRIHTYEEFENCYLALRRAGAANINIDLMSALPGQSVANWEDTLRKVTALGPEHISAYSLIIEEGTPFFDLYESGELTLPDEEKEREMYHLAKRILAECGYERYEISNYAKPGCECRHNIRYWRRDPYLGFGIGAASMYGELKHPGGAASMTIPDRLGEFSGQYRRTNGAELGKYLACYGAGEPGAELIRCDGSVMEELSLKEAVEEFMFLGLRMTEGVSSGTFCADFGMTIDAVYGDVIEKFIDNGLLERRGDRIALTERGLDLGNVVMGEFLL